MKKRCSCQLIGRWRLLKPTCPVHWDRFIDDEPISKDCMKQFDEPFEADASMRNKGMHQYRFKQNPLEERFAVEWERHNEQGRTLDYILAKDNNRPNSDDVTERDRLVAATVIQWLGSPVGQEFIEKVLK